MNATVDHDADGDGSRDLVDLARPVDDTQDPLGCVGLVEPPGTLSGDDNAAFAAEVVFELPPVFTIVGPVGLDVPRTSIVTGG